MANQRPHISLDELSKKISKDVAHHIADFIDEREIAETVMHDVQNEDDFDSALRAIEWGIQETCDDEEILKTVTQSLKEAGFTNDPPAAAEASNVGGDMNIAETVAAAVRAATADLRPQPSMLSMDVTALREHILTNCKTIHVLYNIPMPPSISADIIMTSDGYTNFRASVGRTLPGTGVMITIESAACASTTIALEHLYRISCLTLTRCRASAKNKGGEFLNWKVVIPLQ